MKKINTYLSLNIEKMIVIFLWLQPIIDVFTAVMIHNFHRSFTIGIILRMLFFLLMVYSIVFLNNTKEKKKYLIYFGFIFLYIILYTINTTVQKGGEVLWYEFQNLFKFLYFPVLLISFFLIKKDSKKIKKQLSILFLIYLVFVLIPNMFHLGFESYEITKKGSIGWFYTANEIGAILSILLPFYLNKVKQNKLVVILSILVIFLTFASMGTKGPLLSLFLILGYYFIKYMIQSIKEQKYKILTGLFIGCFVVLVSLIFIIPKTTFYQNIIIHLEFLEVEKLSDLANLKTIDHFVFSERLSFLKKAGKLWQESNFSSKIIGIGYIDHYSTDNVSMKMIEMDYFDIFIRQGAFGFLLEVGTVLLLIKNSKEKRKNIKIEPYILSLILALLLALLTGHVILSPAVSIYVALIFDFIYNERNKGDKMYD